VVVGHGIPEHEVDAGQLPKSYDAVTELLVGGPRFVYIGEIVDPEGTSCKLAPAGDKIVNEKMRLIDQLDEDDKLALYRMIDCMLTKNKFKDFFNQNIAFL
jgi:hypothetical protein